MVGIERKLDELAEAMKGLVRIEERQIAQSTGMERLSRRADQFDSRLHDLELKVAESAPRTASNEWMIRLVMSGAVGLVSALAGYMAK